MLYKFKSQATGDLIMLEPNGRQILKIIGKEGADTLAQGILSPADMPQAIAALEAAIKHDEAMRLQRAQQARERDETPEHEPAIALRQRARPFIDMLKHCLKEDKDLVWGV